MKGIRELQSALAEPVPKNTSCSEFIDPIRAEIDESITQAHQEYHDRASYYQGAVFPLYCGFKGPKEYNSFYATHPNQ